MVVNFQKSPVLAQPNKEVVMSAHNIKILAFSGSTRNDSFNKKLVRIAANGAKAKGAIVTFIDLKDYPLPLYDEDLEMEEGIPSNASRLKEIFIENNGLLIASPEYNGGYSAVLKNVIDWISRPTSSTEKPLSAFNNKKASIMATSPGALGGLRGLYHLRELLLNINITVLPKMHSVGYSHDAFNDDWKLTDPEQQKQIEALGWQLVSFS